MRQILAHVILQELDPLKLVKPINKLYYSIWHITVSNITINKHVSLGFYYHVLLY